MLTDKAIIQRWVYCYPKHLHNSWKRLHYSQAGMKGARA